MTLRLAITIGFAALVSLSPARAKAQEAEVGKCSVKSLRGSYAFKASGLLYGAVPPPGVTLAGPATLTQVGVVTFDGNGGMTMTSTSSFVGFILPLPPVTGTYAVDPNCTGTIALNDIFADTIYVALSDNGKRMFGLYTTLVDGGTKPGPSITLDFAKQ